MSKQSKTDDVQYDCDDCRHNKRTYADGPIQKNWEPFTGDNELLPKVPDNSKFWTVQECLKSTKKVWHLNIDGKCSLFQQRKQLDVQ